MKQYVLDSSAILIYLRDAPDAVRVEKLLREAAEGLVGLGISAVNWAECRHHLVRELGAKETERLLNSIAKGMEIVAADRQMSELAGDLKCRIKASLADCFAAAVTKLRRATLVTSDPEFQALKPEIKILWLESRNT
jgi:predicted nucleic acid-binding protein